jgi:sugar lactone lactonase YvrE
MIVTSCTRQQTMSNGNSAPPGTVTTLAGPSFAAPGGGGLIASFYEPFCVAVDNQGNEYVADYGNNLIRKIDSGGNVSTFAGTGSAGSADGPGLTATFNSPIGVALDNSGNLYVADYGNNKIRVISPAGVVSTLAGTGNQGANDGAGTVATFNGPTGIAVDNLGDVYVADQKNQKIRVILPPGNVFTAAGTGAKGFANGSSDHAVFNLPIGVAVDKLGNIYVADNGNNMIRMIDPNGKVTTLAGTGSPGSNNGPAVTATFRSPFGVTVDTLGNIFVADQQNNMIRLINSSGVVSTLAGTGANGEQNGIGATASFANPSGIAVDEAGNLYVSDLNNNVIRKISVADSVTTLAGNGNPGLVNSTVSGSFSNPTGVAVDSVGNVYVVDQGNNVIRKIDSKGVVTTLAGNGKAISIDGPDLAASFNTPDGIAIDQKGNIYVSEIDNKIRMISPSGMVSTLAGSGAIGSANGVGSAASFTLPAGLAVDHAGNVYVADVGNNLIRMITPADVVSTLAGGGTGGFANGSTMPSFKSPVGVAVDASGGSVYVVDAGNNMIRQIALSGGQTFIIAGNGAANSFDGQGTAASFNNPAGIAVDVAGNIYVSDYGGERIRLINQNFSVSTLAGNGSVGSANGVGAAATFNKPAGIAVDAHGTLYVADKGNNLIRMITQTP